MAWPVETVSAVDAEIEALPVVLHVFVKKLRKTPRCALATARERMRQVIR